MTKPPKGSAVEAHQLRPRPVQPDGGVGPMLEKPAVLEQVSLLDQPQVEQHQGQGAVVGGDEGVLPPGGNAVHAGPHPLQHPGGAFPGGGRGVEPVRQQMAHQPAAQLFRLGPGEVLQRAHVLLPQGGAGLRRHVPALEAEFRRVPAPGQVAGHAAGEGHLPQLVRRLPGLLPAQLGEGVVAAAEEQLPLIAGGLAVADEIEIHVGASFPCHAPQAAGRFAALFSLRSGPSSPMRLSSRF